jgi:hypothetical protein
MLWKTASVVSLYALLAVPGFAQQPAASQPVNSTCTFEDGKEARISYTPPVDTPKKRELVRDKMWTPADQPMTLFLNGRVSLAGTTIPPGAYSLHVVPAKDKWTLVVNKDVSGHVYDPGQDLVRSPMETGQLPDSQPFQLAFARMKATQCSLRIYYGRIGVWAEFNQQ